MQKWRRARGCGYRDPGSVQGGRKDQAAGGWQERPASKTGNRHEILQADENTDETGKKLKKGCSNSCIMAAKGTYFSGWDELEHRKRYIRTRKGF